MTETMEKPELDKVILLRGGHGSREEGCCAMELVAWLAGEPHSDHPACTSPLLGEAFRWANDRLGEDDRQRLKPYLPRLIGTNDGREEQREWIAIDWCVHALTPMWLDAAGLDDHAAELRSLAPISDRAALAAARPTIALAIEAAKVKWRTVTGCDWPIAITIASAIASASAIAIAIAIAIASASASAIARIPENKRQEIDRELEPYVARLRADAAVFLDRLIAG